MASTADCKKLIVSHCRSNTTDIDQFIVESRKDNFHYQWEPLYNKQWHLKEKNWSRILKEKMDKDWQHICNLKPNCNGYIHRLFDLKDTDGVLRAEVIEDCDTGNLIYVKVINE